MPSSLAATLLRRFFKPTTISLLIFAILTALTPAKVNAQGDEVEPDSIIVSFGELETWNLDYHLFDGPLYIKWISHPVLEHTDAFVTYEIERFHSVMARSGNACYSMLRSGAADFFIQRVPCHQYNEILAYYKRSIFKERQKIAAVPLEQRLDQ